MRENVWNKYSKEELTELEKLCDDYRDFLDNGKTERECVNITIDMAKKAGYSDINDLIKTGKKVEAGDKVYASVMGAKAVDLLIEGKKNRVVGYKDGEFIDFDIFDALKMHKEIPDYQVEIAKML